MKIELGPVPAEKPLKWGKQKQLLVDTHILCDWWKVAFVQTSVKKQPDNPVLIGDKPWEVDQYGRSSIAPASVFYEEGKGVFKIWYYGVSKLKRGILYATSEDGIHWEKPNLGLVNFEGSPDNNICRVEPFGKPMTGTFALVDKAPRDKHSFTAFGLRPYHEDGSSYGAWSCGGVSDDGLTWSILEDGITSTSSGASSVPEPTTLVLLSAGLIGLVGTVRRKKLYK